MTPEKRPITPPAEAAVFSSQDADKYSTLAVFELKNLPENWPNILNKRPIRFHPVLRAEANPLQEAQEKAGDYSSGDVARRLAAEREAFVGEVETASGSLIVTFGWVALTAEPLGNTGCSFEPPPGDAYLYDFATLPQYRGQGFYPTLLRYILGELAGRGLKRAWITVAPGNLTSVRSISRAGFTKVADTDYIPAAPGRPAYFELLKDERFDAALQEIGRRALITNRS
jgi:ribosomal protein S18 acetylase RimI-like enzyme